MRLAVGELQDASGKAWRAGGMMIQNVAEDDARGATVVCAMTSPLVVDRGQPIGSAGSRPSAPSQA